MKQEGKSLPPPAVRINVAVQLLDKPNACPDEAVLPWPAQSLPDGGDSRRAALAVSIADRFPKG
jgi:hypothetical protein